MNQDEMSNRNRGLSIDASFQVEKRGISQSLILFTIDICDKYFFCIIRKKVDKNFSVFLKRKEKRH
jgi:hypothetical protein